jgi:hypothetical protein
LTPKSTSISWAREELLQLLSVSATLAGLSITVVALMNTFEKKVALVSIVDDMFAVCALMFLICVYLIFSTLGFKNLALIKKMISLLDIIFLAAMTGMTLAAFIMIYTVW